MAGTARAKTTKSGGTGAKKASGANAATSASITATVDAGALNHAVSIAKRAVRPGDSIPALQYLLVRLDADGTCSVTGTCMDVEITVEFEYEPGSRPGCAEAGTGFAICLNAARLAALVASFDETRPVTLEADDGTGVKIRWSSMVAELPTLEADTFPRRGTGAWTQEFECPARAFARQLETASAAMSKDTARYYLQGVFMATDGEHLKMLATDGHRLVETRNPDLPEGIRGVAGDMAGVIIPDQTVKLLIASLSGLKEECPVSVRLSDRHIEVAIAGQTLCSALVDGKFPDTDRILAPTERYENTWTFDTRAFHAMMKRVITLAGRADSACARISIEGDTLTATVRDPDHGTATDTIAITRSSGAETFGFGVNARYMIDLTGLITTDTTTLSLGTPDDPVLMSEERFGDRFIVMPMRL